MVDPVSAAIADVGTRNKATVGAAVDRTPGDGYAISIYCECRQASFEASSEIRFASSAGNWRSPLGAAPGGIQADEIEFSAPALVDVV